MFPVWSAKHRAFNEDRYPHRINTVAQWKRVYKNYKNYSKTTKNIIHKLRMEMAIL